MLINTLELQFDFVGQWHIGLIQNGNFVKYISNQNIVVQSDSANIDLTLIFLGKDHLNAPNSVAKLTNIYYNDLLLNEIINYVEFYTDNADYKVIKNCDYVNLNGSWNLKFSLPDIQHILRERLT